MAHLTVLTPSHTRAAARGGGRAPRPPRAPGPPPAPGPGALTMREAYLPSEARSAPLLPKSAQTNEQVPRRMPPCGVCSLLWPLRGCR